MKVCASYFCLRKNLPFHGSYSLLQKVAELRGDRLFLTHSLSPVRPRTNFRYVSRNDPKVILHLQHWGDKVRSLRLTGYQSTETLDLGSQ